MVFHTAPASYADGKLTTEYISLAGNPGSGSVRVTTSGGSDAYAVMYSNH